METSNKIGNTESKNQNGYRNSHTIESMSPIIVMFILLFVMFTFSSAIKAQNTDSLKHVIASSKSDTVVIKTSIELVEAIYEERPKEANDLNVSVKTICEKGLKSRTNNKKLKLFYTHYLALAYNNIGLYFDDGDPKALEYFTQSIKIAESINDNQVIAESNTNAAVCYSDFGNIPCAINCYMNSLSAMDKMGDRENSAYTLTNIGCLFQKQGDNIKALEYVNKGLDINLSLKNKDGEAKSLLNLGYIYIEQGNAKKSIEYSLKSLVICREMKNKRREANNLFLIGKAYVKLGDFSKALEYLRMSLKIQEEIKHKQGMTYSLNYISLGLIKQGKLNEAFTGASKSMKLSKELGFPESIRNAASTLKTIYKQKGDFKNAFEMYELETKMRDSVSNEETKKASVRKQFQYEYEKKAAADSVVNAEAQKVKNAQLAAQQAQLKQEKTMRVALYAGLVLVLVFSGFVFNRFKITQKQKSVIESQKQMVEKAYEKLHEKNKEVMDSIMYASRIQKALLTTNSYMIKNVSRLKAA